MKQRTAKRRHKARKVFFVLLFLLAMLFAVCFVTGQTSFLEIFQFSGQVASTEHGWNLILVNSEYRIPKGWNIELTELSNGQSVDSRIYPELQQMFNDMRSQGVYPVVASGYRTAEKQRELIDEKVESFISQGYDRTEAKSEAKKRVAAVGHSEHQTGLAVDINADGVNSTGEQVYVWLADNAWKYGFILRYPADKIEITGTDYEPWHYRYVGVDAAAAIYHQGVCLEEYIDTLD